MITRSRGIELLSFLRFHIIHTILILANKKMPFDQMARPNVEITLLQDNMMEITITGMILLLLRRLNILNLQIIQTMLLKYSKHVDLQGVQRILLEQFDV